MSGRELLNMTANLVHTDWEVLDPTPDVNSMFRRFDDRFFSRKLRCVALEWSKKMYSCAGICYMRKNRLGQSITIRLSEPLLKLRPRKDLVQTLLHEMIHAFAFSKGVREGNGGHGPFFHKMMNEINKVAGTNISVYHTFHDEVNVYKKHVWRCNGICKERKPFFGYVRRVSNRAPGPNDAWWSQHQQTCGGYFQKFSEPEKEKRTKRTAEGTKKTAAPAKRPLDKNQPRINDIFSIPAPAARRKTPSPAAVIPRRAPPPAAAAPPSRFPGSNIRGFPDLPSEDSPPRSGAADIAARLAVPLFAGLGNLLNRDRPERDIFQSIQEQVRSIWEKRDLPQPQAKRPRLPETQRPTQEPQKEPMKMNQWQMVDDDIAMRTPYVPFVDLADSDEAETDGDDDLRDHNELLTQMANKTVSERRSMIQQELFESEGEDEIVMIDDEFDETLVVGSAGQTALDDTVTGGERNPPATTFSQDDVVKCPICEGGVSRSYLPEHMEEGCTGIRQNVPFVRNRADMEGFGATTTFTSSAQAAASSSAGAAAAFGPATVSPPRANDEIRYPCPNCGMRYAESRINEHLDQCLA